MNEKDKALLIVKNFQGTMMNSFACDLLLDQIWFVLCSAKREGWNEAIEEVYKILCEEEKNRWLTLGVGKGIKTFGETAKEIRKLKKEI